MKMDKIPTTQEEMQSAFDLSQRQNEMAQVLKELFEENKITMITDLTKDEIKIATRIYMISKIKKIKIWEEGLFFYFKMLLNKDRKSRKEILDAIKGYSQRENFLQRINPFRRSGSI